MYKRISVFLLGLMFLLSGCGNPSEELSKDLYFNNKILKYSNFYFFSLENAGVEVRSKITTDKELIKEFQEALEGTKTIKENESIKIVEEIRNGLKSYKTLMNSVVEGKEVFMLTFFKNLDVNAMAAINDLYSILENYNRLEKLEYKNDVARIKGRKELSPRTFENFDQLKMEILRYNEITSIPNDEIRTKIREIKYYIKDTNPAIKKVKFQVALLNSIGNYTGGGFVNYTVDGVNAFNAPIRTTFVAEIDSTGNLLNLAE